MFQYYDAFISYGRADSKTFATKLYQDLTKQGFKIWFDQNDIPLGVDFQNQIDVLSKNPITSFLLSRPTPSILPIVSKK